MDMLPFVVLGVAPTWNCTAIGTHCLAPPYRDLENKGVTAAIKRLTHMCAKWHTWVAVTGLGLLLFCASLQFVKLGAYSNPLTVWVADEDAELSQMGAVTDVF